MSENIYETEVVQADALGSIERAQIDVQIATARKYGRQMSQVKEAMLNMATLDEETAQGCFYTLPARKGGDGKALQGPSVRMAEIAIASYGHIRAGARIIADDGKFITAQGAVHDLLNNVYVTIEVKRRVTTKDGKRYSDDMIATTGNAACSIALRNAAFRVVPRAIITPVYDAARRVAVGDVKSLTTKRAKVIERLKAAGAAEANILAAVNAAKVEDIDLGKLETLIGLGTAMKDGTVSLEEAFPAPQEEKPAPQFKPRAKTAQEATPPPATDFPAADTKPQPVVEVTTATVDGGGSLTASQAKLMSIIESEGGTFQTLLYICGDPNNGLSAWKHIVEGVKSPDQLKEHDVQQLLGKEKPFRGFIQTAVAAGIK